MPREKFSTHIDVVSHPEVYEITLAYINELMALANEATDENIDQTVQDSDDQKETELVADQQMLKDFVGIGSLEGYSLRVVNVYELPAGVKSSTNVLKEVELLKDNQVSPTRMWIIEETHPTDRKEFTSEELSRLEYQSKKVNFYILTQKRPTLLENGEIEERLRMYVEGKVKDASLKSELTVSHTDALAYVQNNLVCNGGEFIPEHNTPSGDHSIKIISLVSVTDIGNGTAPIETMTKLGGKGNFVETFAFAYPILQYRQGVQEVRYKQSSVIGQVGNGFINMVLSRFNWLYKASNVERKITEGPDKGKTMTTPAIEVAFHMAEELATKVDFKRKVHFSPKI